MLFKTPGCTIWFSLSCFLTYATRIMARQDKPLRPHHPIPIQPKLLKPVLIPRPCFPPAKRGTSFAMSDFHPGPSDRRSPLPGVQPAGTCMSSSSLVAAASSNARSSTSSSVSGCCHSLSTGSSLAALYPGCTPSVPLPPRTEVTRVACETCRRRRIKVSLSYTPPMLC